MQALLTLDGHVPAGIQLMALRSAEECALKVLFGVSWRPDEEHAPVVADQPAGHAAFIGEVGLTRGGRVVVRVPSQPPLVDDEDLVDGVIRVPWSSRALSAYRHELSRAEVRRSTSIAECREWLAGASGRRRDEILDELKEAALRTAPFVLYQDGRRYTNFREHNTLTGKTLWPGHPDCALSNLQGLPLDLWSDSDAVTVVCLFILIRSSSFARIEEANGTQLTVDHVAALFVRASRNYGRALDRRPLEPAEDWRVEDLYDLAGQLREQRKEVTRCAQLYRKIHGPLMHKVECVADPLADSACARLEKLSAHLRANLPVTGETLDDFGAGIDASPLWLAQPHGDFASGLELLVHETVTAARIVFDADFAMSRGLRSLPKLVEALRAEDWAETVSWELPEFFCCVVADPEARRFFDNSPSQLADIAWSMSARMQYNSWHFLPGNLPRVPEVVARDHFVPPTIPDIAYFSDQHHRGHVAAQVRFSIRSPQAIQVDGRTFHGFVDLRLLRCDRPPFDEQDLLAAHKTSAFVARATSAAAALVAAGHELTVASFDSAWHWATIAGGAGTVNKGAPFSQEMSTRGPAGADLS